MRAKSEIRKFAENLRIDKGLSYKEISIITGVSKSTLSGWLKEIPLSPIQQSTLREKMEANRESFTARAWLVNRLRYSKVREEADQAGVRVFNELPQDRSVDELALAMLYLGEGSKSYGRVQIASTQPPILRYFLKMLIQLYKIDEARLTFRLNLVRAAKELEKDYIEWWKTELKYSPARFIKTQFDSRSQSNSLSENYRGVCTLTYYDTFLQRKLISLASIFIQTRSAS
jgi:transcriptional regulator with XRE-family HTH domain